MKEVLLAPFIPQDEMWDAQKNILYIKETENLQAYQREFAHCGLGDTQNGRERQGF